MVLYDFAAVPETVIHIRDEIGALLKDNGCPDRLINRTCVWNGGDDPFGSAERRGRPFWFRFFRNVRNGRDSPSVPDRNERAVTLFRFLVFCVILQ